LLAGWEEAGWPAAAIGQILPPGSGLWAMQQGERLPLPAFQADELTRLWQ
jgi:predicted oxidoreductase